MKKLKSMYKTKYLRQYANFLRGFLHTETPIKAVIDCSNGTTGPVIKKLLRGNKLMNVSFINFTPDGKFPAHGPNPLNEDGTRQLHSAILENESDFGVVFDADGDRAVFLDDKGKVVNATYVLNFLAPLFNQPYIINAAEGKTPIGWLSPNLQIIESKTGHYFIKKLMREKDIEFAVERSGHYYFKDFYYADSGILAFIFFSNQVSTLRKNGTMLSEWKDSQPQYFWFRDNIKTNKQEEALFKIEKILKQKSVQFYKLDGITVSEDNFWFNVRPSNTEPVLRINMAAKTESVLKKEKAELLEILGQA